MQHDSCTFAAVSRFPPVDRFADTARLTRAPEPPRDESVFVLHPVAPAGADGRGHLWARDPELRRELRELMGLESSPIRG